jgi:hypothetical protein
MNGFPTNEQFSEQVKVAQQSDIVKWRDLPQNVTFKINAIKTIDAQYGKSTILDIENVDGETSRVWCCSRMASELLDYDWRDLAGYFLSFGLLQSIQDASRQYYSYHLEFRKKH